MPSNVIDRCKIFNLTFFQARFGLIEKLRMEILTVEIDGRGPAAKGERRESSKQVLKPTSCMPKEECENNNIE